MLQIPELLAHQQHAVEPHTAKQLNPWTARFDPLHVAAVMYRRWILTESCLVGAAALESAAAAAAAALQSIMHQTQ
jgi:hypothetical protein